MYSTASDRWSDGRDIYYRNPYIHGRRNGMENYSMACGYMGNMYGLVCESIISLGGLQMSKQKCTHGIALNEKCFECARSEQEQKQEMKKANNIDTTLAERESTYGNFADHARITQSIKSAMVDSPNWAKLPDDMKEALEMNAHKIGRILNGDPNYHDSWHDIIGYTKLIADRLEPK